VKRLGPLLLLLVAWPFAARAQLFSPGPLSRAHHGLEGLRNCTRCHEGGRGLSQQKCLACHTELQPQIAAHAGFHGRIPDAQRACESCHHEHQGLDFHLIEWVPSRAGFPHAKTGWALEGKHRPLGCERCHTPKLISAPAIREMLAKNPGRTTYLGLPTRCAGCHFDEHRGQLRSDCASCHSVQDWKKTPGFDHQRTAYPLTGRHRRVACQKCHPAKRDEHFDPKAVPAPRAETFLALSDIPHQTCDTCHADPHGGKFEQRCEACHTTAGWLKVKGAGIRRDFHEKTRFPLRGQHQEVDCKACHGPFPGRRARFKGLAFGKCADCHPDGHEGQLARRGQRAAPDCDACHTVNGFIPARFDVPAHAKTPFPLKGGHQAVPCNGCHRADRSLLDRVPRALLALLKRERRPLLVSPVVFRFSGELDRCDSCHRDPHGGQFAAKVKASGCTVCHRDQSFHTLAFDHDRDSRYPLEGPHAKAACEGCHRAGAAGVVQYTGVSRDCQACHLDVHRGQFAQAGGTDCARCHTVSAFAQAPRFVHAPPFTPFRLEGAHAKASCGRCHRERVVDGVKVERFVGLPTTCAGCHQDFHQGAFRGFSP
jgi:hypothetical protein